MVAFGLAEEAEAARRTGTSDGPFLVYRHNWPTFDLWRTVWNQWRWIPGMAPVRDGIDWCQVQAVMNMNSIAGPEQGRILKGLRAMQEEFFLAQSENQAK
ncbi:MAG TPA: DUF1799 domain-containing protein [Rhodocyclaceae bacterium]|nr:DUF1799 domain-containing protein [Rhodocyclaceae bacterium]